MSHAHSIPARAFARHTRALVKKAGAKLAGKKPGSSPVHRNSFDVDDAEARIGRRLGDGSVRQAIAYIETLLETAHQLYLRDRRKEDPERLRKSDLLVLRTLLTGPWLDYKTGHLDPAHQTIADKAGVDRTTVLRALKRLSFHGLLKWVRRTRRVAEKGSAGPQRAQTSNAYGFDWRRKMESGVWHRFKELLDRRLERMAPKGSMPVPSPLVPQDPALAAALAGLGSLVASASG